MSEDRLSREGRPGSADEVGEVDEMRDGEREEGDDPLGGSRRKRRGLSGCLAVLVALAVLAGGAYVAVTRGAELLADQFSSAEDFSGPGSGEVTFEVADGDTIADMGRGLKDQGVVASVQAFIDAAAGEPDSNSIQVGFYALQEQMPAADALAVLMDPANQVKSTVTVPEGLRVVDVLDILVEQTTFKRAAYERALEDPAGLGLPDYAGGNAEGYLFPATYEVPPDATAKSVLTAMVDRWRQAAEDVDLEGSAAALGRTPAELMTIASLVEAEGRGEDMPKIARVIYNRLENPDNGVTNGLLQIDASVNYGQDQSLGAVPTTEDIEADTPYNTYTRPGLPPTPIEAPGDDALAAAANPADGNWLFYVTVDLESGETKFTESYEKFLAFKDELRDYCANESEAC
ncbi:endolytic transglycosylase MltG [uncultured Nocardioides sp.]|uniref:endolytic transglycosylase MltG n=1 Tax=uncultured Nocardioides sp. TaxID=198441 RepID=UPI0025E51AE7|nr:endolytic transglycosylase MltG [uncultured Nocardioides sp.]